MLEACRKVRRYTAGMPRAEFLADERTYDAVVRNLAVLGEAAKQVPQEKRVEWSQIEWRKIAGLRDFLVHAYFGIDDDILWNVIEQEIPRLEPRLIALLSATTAD